ncbi:MAG: hypothetical protein ACTSWR_08845 [Candidatus Helarchaeota archaeon]
MKKKTSQFPKILEKPLIKSNKNGIVAFKSGMRSAILFHDNKYYRIKGCGMENDGFVYETYLPNMIDSNGIRKKRLRGCQFLENCEKEIEVSKKLGNVFKKKNLFFPNFPLGYWVYETNFDEDPCASLYETYGEIRLNDDFLYLLESRLDQNPSFFGGLLKLYYKIGQHVGFIKKTINEAGYLWGTFFGDKDMIFHSNSHINNIIVAKIGDTLTLGPTDFDLAYLPGDLDTKEFEQKVLDENLVLEASIKGWEVFDPLLKLYKNFKSDKLNNDKLNNMRIKLRNKLFKGFKKGFKEKPDEIKFSEIKKFFY